MNLNAEDSGVGTLNRLHSVVTVRGHLQPLRKMTGSEMRADLGGFYRVGHAICSNL